jgi:hypothetical protein
MTDIVKQVEKHLSTQKTAPRGLENSTDKNDLIIPRAKKIEAMSPEMQDTELLKAGIHSGVIINSITKEILPEKFIPVSYFKQWIRFNANKEGDRGWVDGYGPRDVIYNTQDKDDLRIGGDAVWEGELPPLATTFLCFLAIFEGQDVPVVVSFGGTNFKTGKTLLSLATFKGGDLFSNQYKLTTKKKTNDMGSWFVFDVAFAGKPSAEEYAKAEAMYEAFKPADAKIHEDLEPGSEG